MGRDCQRTKLGNMDFNGGGVLTHPVSGRLSDGPSSCTDVVVAQISTVSFVQELKETMRRLVQHLLFAALLSVQLYTLPLLYILRRVAHPGERCLGSSVSFNLKPFFFFDGRMDLFDLVSRSSLYRLCSKFRAAVYEPVRAVRVLYRLACFIEENPEVLRPSTAQDLSSSKSRAVEQSHDSSMSVISANEITEMLQSPSSASQVYHAALANGTTLDDLLASFESNDQLQRFRITTTEAQRLLEAARGRVGYRDTSPQTFQEELLPMPEAGEGSSACRTLYDDSPTPDNASGRSGLGWHLGLDTVQQSSRDQDAVPEPSIQQVNENTAANGGGTDDTISAPEVAKHTRCSVYERRHLYSISPDGKPAERKSRISSPTDEYLRRRPVINAPNKKQKLHRKPR